MIYISVLDLWDGMNQQLLFITGFAPSGNRIPAHLFFYNDVSLGMKDETLT